MFSQKNLIYHTFQIGKNELPKNFTYPFYYQPHPLCIQAAEEVQDYLEKQTDFDHNFGLDSKAKGLVIGKMFGVMIVQTPEGEIGYLAAFSGKLGESNELKGFVPPIYNTLDEEGFYKKGEKTLNVMNAKIDALESSHQYKEAQHLVQQILSQSDKDIQNLKKHLKILKIERDAKRKQSRETLSDKDLADFESKLDNESISLNYKLKHLKVEWKKRLAEAREALQTIKNDIDTYKNKRRELSATLQRQLHQSYTFLNAKGEFKNLLDIFEAQPPAAAGECAAPKLLQFAYENQLKPIAMAEFWWGASPKSQIRKHKHFYPSCRSKCEPILGHMLMGLKVDENPILTQNPYKVALHIIYEDDYLIVINKPNEVLSVPGKHINKSILTALRSYLPNVKGPLLVHRLDMSTSGLLVAAKMKRPIKIFKNSL